MSLERDLLAKAKETGDLWWPEPASEARHLYEMLVRDHCLAQSPAATASTHPIVARQLKSLKVRADHDRRKVLFELDRVTHILAKQGISFIVLKGAAYASLGLSAADGRRMSDLDILIQEETLPRAESALREAGYKDHDPDLTPYDNAYYREKMHELAPLVHPLRQVTVDLHFRLTPRSARLQVPTDKLWSAAVFPDADRPLGYLSPQDRFLHAAQHALYDGSVDYPARSFFDLACLYEDLNAADRQGLMRRAADLKLERVAATALAFIDPASDRPQKWILTMVDAKLAGANWARVLLYLRGHMLRMPLLQLARHAGAKIWARLPPIR